MATRRERRGSGGGGRRSVVPATVGVVAVGRVDDELARAGGRLALLRPRGARPEVVHPRRGHHLRRPVRRAGLGGAGQDAAAVAYVADAWSPR